MQLVVVVITEGIGIMANLLTVLVTNGDELAAHRGGAFKLTLRHSETNAEGVAVLSRVESIALQRNARIRGTNVYEVERNRVKWKGDPDS